MLLLFLLVLFVCDGNDAVISGSDYRQTCVQLGVLMSTEDISQCGSVFCMFLFLCHLRRCVVFLRPGKRWIYLILLHAWIWCFPYLLWSWVGLLAPACFLFWLSPLLGLQWPGAVVRALASSSSTALLFYIVLNGCHGCFCKQQNYIVQYGKRAIRQQEA